MKRFLRIAAVAGTLALGLEPAAAQQQLGAGSTAEGRTAPGWTFTPSFGFGDMYDDNISLFTQGTAEGQRDDFVQSYYPSADLRYLGKYTSLNAGYSGGFLNYQTFSALNRWDQRGRAELRRRETARFNWNAGTTYAAAPSTDFVELAGIPYRRVGAQTFDLRGGVEYKLSARDALTGSYQYQSIAFGRPIVDRDVLRGGHVQQYLATYRRQLDERLSIGADYSYRESQVRDDNTPFGLQQIQAAAVYSLSPEWTLNAGAGFVHLQSTAITEARTGPSWRVALERRRGLAAFTVDYLRSYIPSLGFGGSGQNQELGAALRLPLFNSRHWYTEQSTMYRDDQPLTSIIHQLPLHSFRTFSVLGWDTGRWLRIEGFYNHVQQTSTLVGGDVSINRVGFQIVTSKPMRLQ